MTLIMISLRTVSTELTSSDLRGILLTVEGIDPGPAKVDALATRNFSNWEDSRTCVRHSMCPEPALAVIVCQCL
jgi:hypothetical protein